MSERIVTSAGYGTAIGTVTPLRPNEVPLVVAAARRALGPWSMAAPHARAALLHTAADNLATESAALGPAHAAESGKILTQAEHEVRGAVALLRRNADLARDMASEVAPTGSLPGGERDLTLVDRVPLGVVVAVIPFNFPIELTMEKLAAAVATGNTVIVKLPPQNPLATLRAVQAVARDLPEGVVQCVDADAEVSEALCCAPGVDAVSLTGSVGAGLAVARSTAHLLRPLHLELGGNGAAIVREDADLDLVVSETLRGRLLMNGQACAATKRVIAHRKVAKELTERLVDAFAAIYPGDPTLPQTRLGPLISAHAATTVETQVQRAISAGARRATGTAPDGAWFSPTVLADVPHDAALLHDDEVFGPVVPIAVVDSDDQAIDLANATTLRLTAAVFSADWQRSISLARRLDFGGVVVNGTNNYRPPVVPFGGVAMAGSGREGLGWTIKDLTRTRFIALRGLLPPGSDPFNHESRPLE